MQFSTDTALPIPRIENRHIRCQNVLCKSCPPRRAAKASVTPIESARVLRKVPILATTVSETTNTPNTPSRAA